MTIADDAAAGRLELAQVALIRVQWACEALHLSQTAFIKRLIDLPLSDFLGCHKSASTVKSYLQGNIPKTAPELLDKLILAVACFFNLSPDDFYDTALGKEAFIDKIRNVDGQSNRTLHALSQENRYLKEKVATLERQLCKGAVMPGGVTTGTVVNSGNGAGTDDHPSCRRRWFALPSATAAVLIGCVLVSGVLLAWAFYTPDAPYPPRRAPEIQRATLDGRDIELNTVSTPMMVAYGSMLCVSLVSDGFYASAFVEDRGFYFNQEGRLLISPHDSGEKCTGIWPGIPDAFHKSPYQLFIVVSAERLPVIGDADRRREIPPGSYFGPIYIQRTE